MKQKHELKTINPYFTDIYEDVKTFEVRKNDRNFSVGDVLVLKEFVPPETYTGRVLKAEITYILNDPEYCKDGYVILGIGLYACNF